VRRVELLAEPFSSRILVLNHRMLMKHFLKRGGKILEKKGTIEMLYYRYAAAFSVADIERQLISPIYRVQRLCIPRIPSKQGEDAFGNSYAPHSSSQRQKFPNPNPSHEER
jgi:hypothetical protein